MEQIWSPWRKKYIQQQYHSPDCIFCAALTQEDGAENLVVYRGEWAFVILNRYPYTNGHLMVVPKAHKATLDELNEEERAELMRLLAESERILQAEYAPEGFNIGANLGKAAGAGVAGHLHFHVVPRWAGDTNFMTTLAETRVLPEELGETLAALTRAWQK